MQQPAGIVLDFDGVILESVDLKAEAFRRLFATYPEHVDEIVRLHLEQGGLSRYEKLRRIYRDILKLPLSDEEMARLDREFGALTVEAIQHCAYVPGAREFIEQQSRSSPLFVASGTPEAELRDVMAGRGLAEYFRGIYGSPRPKPALLSAIVEELGVAPTALVFVGDSMPDYEAAHAAGVPFVGRVPAGQPSPFPPSQRTLVQDLAELAARWSRLEPTAPVG